MLVTINTDASFCQKNKVGGFAFWISCNKGRFKHSGPLKEVGNSGEAELMSVANALAFMLKMPQTFENITRLIINTDCKFVITVKSERPKGGKPQVKARSIKKMIEGFIANLHINSISRNKKALHKFCEYRHVTAHTGANDKRSFVNEWCDTEAKKWKDYKRKTTTI